jgi:hypothetical protein
MEIIRRELVKIKGIVKITKRDIYGNIVGVSTYENLVTNKGLQLLGDLSIGAATTGITYIAFGNDDTAATINDTALGNETYRKQVAFRSRSSQTITISSYLTTSEGNATYKELGHFGRDATGTANSGDLFNHTIITETKDSSITWTVEQSFTYANA